MPQKCRWTNAQPKDNEKQKSEDGKILLHADGKSWKVGLKIRKFKKNETT